jgi:hypothetical protein
MNSLYYRDREGLKFLEWLFMIFFVLFYPMLVSIYPLLPPLIGIAGLIIIYNINRNIIYTISSMLYLINIDLNLSLPFMLSIFSTLLINSFVYPSAKLILRCKICLGVLIIILVDLFYYINLFIYDFILGANTIIADSMLSFYILIDMIIGLLL